MPNVETIEETTGPRQQPHPAVAAVTEPFPISFVSNRYLLYDINLITYVRREHHICGVLIGTLAKIPQQNVFLGVPLELSPEEARLLVVKGAGYIVDDVRAHADGITGLSEKERKPFLAALAREGRAAARQAEQKATRKKEAAFRKLEAADTDRPSPLVAGHITTVDATSRPEDEQAIGDPDTELDALPAARASSNATSGTRRTGTPLEIYPITPTISYPPLTIPSKTRPQPLPAVPSSYPLYAHLHKHGYYMTPGLRFGCQYSVYPGDPLRFHSHFLAIAVGWDVEMNLMDLVGGGRLGTGVKKGFLIGACSNDSKLDDPQHGGDEVAGDAPGNKGVNEGGASVRTICIEWASM
ncbi:MAG: tRNA-splicing endonuclease subunit [Thelocarpon superellum]|nr:MAG: tRNA-splicing endonuclease subunit [Thelocarpon superellum]